MIDSFRLLDAMYGNRGVSDMIGYAPSEETRLDLTPPESISLSGYKGPRPPASTLTVNKKPTIMKFSDDAMKQFPDFYETSEICQLCFGIDFDNVGDEELKRFEVRATLPYEFTVYRLLPVAYEKPVFEFGAEVKLTLSAGAGLPEISVLKADAKIDGEVTLTLFKWTYKVKSVENRGLMGCEPGWILYEPNTIGGLQFYSFAIVRKKDIKTAPFEVPLSLWAWVSRPYATDPDEPITVSTSIRFQPR